VKIGNPADPAAEFPDSFTDNAAVDPVIEVTIMGFVKASSRIL
jgi:hypothetical protein